MGVEITDSNTVLHQTKDLYLMKDGKIYLKNDIQKDFGHINEDATIDSVMNYVKDTQTCGHVGCVYMALRDYLPQVFECYQKLNPSAEYGAWVDYHLTRKKEVSEEGYRKSRRVQIGGFSVEVITIRNEEDMDDFLNSLM